MADLFFGQDEQDEELVFSAEDDENPSRFRWLKRTGSPVND